MTKFQPFDMERMMSKWENVVEYNLSESGVHPLSVREFVDDPAVIDELLATPLHYAQANGIIEAKRIQRRSVDGTDIADERDDRRQWGGKP